MTKEDFEKKKDELLSKIPVVWHQIALDYGMLGEYEEDWIYGLRCIVEDIEKVLKNSQE